METPSTAASRDETNGQQEEVHFVVAAKGGWRCDKEKMQEEEVACYQGCFTMSGCVVQNDRSRIWTSLWGNDRELLYQEW